MSKECTSELAERAAVELARVAAVRPALSSRCERAAGILADHAASPRAGVSRARVLGAVACGGGGSGPHRHGRRDGIGRGRAGREKVAA